MFINTASKQPMLGHTKSPRLRTNIWPHGRSGVNGDDDASLELGAKQQRQPNHVVQSRRRKKSTSRGKTNARMETNGGGWGEQ